MSLLAAGFGLVLGALLGLVGGGGGILAVPALVYGLGLPLASAVPASLVVIGLASAVAVAPRARREVNWRLAIVIGAAGIPTSIAGGVVNHQLDDQWLMLAFAAIMVLAGLRMLRGNDETGGVCELPGGGVAWRRCLPRAIAVGLLVGFLTGLLGVGGGFLLVPALIVALGLRTPTAVATSLVIIVINAVGRARALPRRSQQRQRSRTGLVDHRPVRRRRDPHLATRQLRSPAGFVPPPCDADSPSWS